MNAKLNLGAGMVFLAVSPYSLRAARAAVAKMRPNARYALSEELSRSLGLDFDRAVQALGSELLAISFDPFADQLEICAIEDGVLAEVSSELQDAI